MEKTCLEGMTHYSYFASSSEAEGRGMKHKAREPYSYTLKARQCCKHESPRKAGAA